MFVHSKLFFIITRRRVKPQLWHSQSCTSVFSSTPTPT